MPPGRSTSEQILSFVRTVWRRHWQRALIWREWLKPSEEAVHLIIAGLVGILAGLANWCYVHSNQLLQVVILGKGGDLLMIAEDLPEWQRVATTTLGALAAGLTLTLGLRLLGNPGLTNLLEAVVAGDGRLRMRPAVINAGSSLISISSGASIGREGLIIQLTAALASKLGQLLTFPPYRLRLLVGCGAAAGLAAGCNAPIAGAVFAAQIVLGTFSMTSFAPLVVSSVVAAVVSRSFFGQANWYEVPSMDFARLVELPLFLVLGVLTGAFGACFLRLLEGAEKLFSRLRLPLYARMGIAGLVVGCIAIPYPEVWGNGYAATTRILHLQEREVVTMLLVGLLFSKLVATVVTVGSGTVGGIFTPTLFLGAGLGSVYGALLHHLGFAMLLPVGAFALIGMGSMLAATTHSPLLAIIMAFELSLNYSVMPPVMIACVVSTLVAQRLHRDSVYSEPLRRKGLDFERESSRIGAASEIAVGDILLDPIPPLLESTTFRQIADRFLSEPNNFLPVVDAGQCIVGLVALHDLKEYLHAGQELDSVIAYDVMGPPPPCLTPDQKLPDILPVLLSSEMRNIPVVNNSLEKKLVGSVARAQALGLLSEAISIRSLPRL